MNTRKFCFIISTILSVFLFIAGTLMLLSLNTAAVDESTPLGDILKPFKAENNPVNFLLLVGDKEEANTDTMMVVNFNPATAKLSILSIPRDTKVDIASPIPKINSSYMVGRGGERGSTYAAGVVSDLLGININYSIYINLASFREIVDKLGGVDFYVPDDLDYDDPTQDLHIHLKKGQQLLDGDKAEQLLRFRKYNDGRATKLYDGNDLNRVNMQQQFIKELIRQKVNISYLTKINDIISFVINNVKTNIKLDDALKLSSNIRKLNSNELNTFRLGGDDKNISTPGYGKISYFVYNNNIINVNTNEEVPSSTIMEQYFSAKSGFVNFPGVTDVFTPEKKSTDTNKSTGKSNSNNKKAGSEQPPKKNFTKSNPSNSETNVKASPEVKP